MSLKKYWEKRKFEKTSEPKGKKEKISKNRFVVHDHFALKAKHHHDLRLEINGILESWAVPKKVPEETEKKVLAIEVEPHPIEYINFKGIIPTGEYGAGIVKIFDKGNFKLISKTENKILFELKGKKLKGNYCLIKLKKTKNHWILFKI